MNRWGVATLYIAAGVVYLVGLGFGGIGEHGWFFPGWWHPAWGLTVGLVPTVALCAMEATRGECRACLKAEKKRAALETELADTRRALTELKVP